MQSHYCKPFVNSFHNKCILSAQRTGYSVSDFGINADDNAEIIFLVHPNVPTSTSELLGVPTLMSRMLASEQTLDFGFGQTDSLTGRLKALLNDYSDGLAIPKELIQNADDAGATEVRERNVNFRSNLSKNFNKTESAIAMSISHLS